jgi:hypothetical protein
VGLQEAVEFVTRLEARHTSQLCLREALRLVPSARTAFLSPRSNAASPEDRPSRPGRFHRRHREVERRGQASREHSTGEFRQRRQVPETIPPLLGVAQCPYQLQSFSSHPNRVVLRVRGQPGRRVRVVAAIRNRSRDGCATRRGRYRLTRMDGDSGCGAASIWMVGAARLCAGNPEAEPPHSRRPTPTASAAAQGIRRPLRDCREKRRLLRKRWRGNREPGSAGE